ncbi:SUKH-3 domain-containing protein [Streptomyces sp. NPDC058451]|uniref:SUKH-3 domain-containing protein n=1 Tax=Streptomyces sp. NPDC058451 TaxID=3346506 RepID=UPI00365A9AE5
MIVAREPFELDPELAWGEDDRFSEWSDSIGRRLVPLGELDHGRYFLGIDENSEIYLVASWIAGFGPMPQALENLILGVKPRRIDDERRPSDQAQ